MCEIYAPSLDHDICALDSANPGCAVTAVRPSRHAGRGLKLGLTAAAFAMLAALAGRRRAPRA